MLVKLTLENAHAHGSLFPDLLRFRGRYFAHYDTHHFRLMEFDQFDNPFATYLVSVAEADRTVRGCARLIRCHLPYMLAQLWPEIRPMDLPARYSACEVSRFALAARAALPDMVAGLVEYAQEACLDEYLFLANRRLIQRLLGPHAPVEAVGGALPTGEQVCRVTLSPEILQATLDFHAAREFLRDRA